MYWKALGSLLWWSCFPANHWVNANHHPNVAHAQPSRKRQPHAAILFAFFFDLRHPHGADFLGGAHMSAAARLQVEVGYLDQPYPASAHRRLHRHGLHLAGIGGELLVADPATAHRGIARDHLVDPRRDRVLVEA